jgi:tRNA threonylcarbamoyladenosine biosynthesis protein TsaB
MARILSLETSTDVCSVAITDSGVLIKELVIREPQAHAAKLAPLIKEIFDNTSFSIREIQAVAITSGPGSYTGLRIGTSTAKGICYALNIPLISIPTLDVLAFQAKNFASTNDLLCPMIDARRMEVYCQIFNTKMHALEDVQAKVLDETSFEELLATRKMFFTGNGAHKCSLVVTNANAVFLKDFVPVASVVGQIAVEKYEKEQFEDLQQFKPFYLKEFVAKKAQPLLG